MATSPVLLSRQLRAMIEGTYTISELEYTEARKAWGPQELRKVPGYWAMQLVGAAFGACFGFSLFRLPLTLAIALSTTFLLYLGILEWRKRAARSYQYRVKHDPSETISIRLDEVGYHFHKEPACGGWLGWSHFTGWREAENTFVLGHGLVYIGIPKRSFSIEVQKEIREMLRARIQPSS